MADDSHESKSNLPAPSSRRENDLDEFHIDVRLTHDSGTRQVLESLRNKIHKKQTWFTKHHQFKMKQLQESVEEGFFKYSKHKGGKPNQLKLDLFHAKYVESYGNDQLYELWQQFLTVCYYDNSERNVGHFFVQLLHYVGFADIGSNLFIVPELNLSSRSTPGRPHSGDIAVGKDTRHLTKDSELKLQELYLFMENKKFDTDANKNDVLAQLIFGAMEAMHARGQFNQEVYLFRNMGAKVTIYKCTLPEDKFECIIRNDLNMQWENAPVQKFCSELCIFDSISEFQIFIEILEKLLLLKAPSSHPKIVQRKQTNSESLSNLIKTLQIAEQSLS